MATTEHMATPEDDRRHAPGPSARPLWSESYWFPLYDPESEIGVVFRVGAYRKRGDANLYLIITHKGSIVHAVTEHRAALPPLDGDSFTVAGLRIDIEKPLERFRLRYAHGSTAFDLAWEAFSPAYKYPTPPSDEFPGHIEQGGRVTGTVMLGGTEYPFRGLGHRDHSWGGERDWTKFKRWTYLSGEFGTDAWFNAVRIDLGDQLDIRIGCMWDGKELLALQAIEIDRHVDVVSEGLDDGVHPSRVVAHVPVVEDARLEGRKRLHFLIGNIPDTNLHDRCVLECPPHRAGVTVLFVEIVVAQVGMSIDLKDAEARRSRDCCSHERRGDRMLAAERDQELLHVHHAAGRGFDLAHGFGNRRGGQIQFGRREHAVLVHISRHLLVPELDLG